MSPPLLLSNHFVTGDENFLIIQKFEFNASCNAFHSFPLLYLKHHRVASVSESACIFHSYCVGLLFNE